MSTGAACTAEEARVWALLEQVPDPEIPVLSIVDLGVVRFVRIEDGQTTVGLAPTYNGCPATEVIEASVLTFPEHEPVSVERIEKELIQDRWIRQLISDQLSRVR